MLRKPLVRTTFLELGRQFLFQIDRREKRIPFQKLVTLHLQGEKIHCATEDLSAHGAYIHCRHVLQEDEKVRVTMVLPGTRAKVVECRGRVAWVNYGFPRPLLGLPQGFGMEFQGLDKEMAGVLRDLVEGDGELFTLGTSPAGIELVHSPEEEAG